MSRFFRAKDIDAVINNSDRKGGHLMRDGDIVRGCDHGVSLSARRSCAPCSGAGPGQPLAGATWPVSQTLLDALGDRLGDELASFLTPAEVRALRSRAEALLRTRHPVPAAGLAGDPVAGRVTGAP